MNLADSVKFIEVYLRDYASYLLNLFQMREARSASTTDLDAKLATYGLISVVLGVLLQETFISGRAFTAIDFPHRITIELCFWMALTLVTYLLLSVMRVSFDLSISLNVVLRTLPLAFLVGSFGAFIAYNLSWYVEYSHALGVAGATGSYVNYDFRAQKDASVADGALQFVLIAVYFPYSLSLAVEGKRVRAWIVGITIVLIVAAVDFCVIFRPSDICRPGRTPNPPGCKTITELTGRTPLEHARDASGFKPSTGGPR